MNPMLLASLAQMGMNFGQGLGGALGTGGSSAWGNALQGSILGGYLTGRGQKKAKKKAQKRFSRALSASEAIQGMGLQQQEALARQATQQQLGGYDAAKREASRLGRSGKQEALDRETQLGASLSQGLTSSGLGSTTRGANLQRGLTADTSRVIGGINEGLAGLFGDLALGRSGVEAQGTEALANIAGQRTALTDQIQQMRQLGGSTLGSLGSFDPGAWTQGYMPNTGAGMMEGLGGLLGGMGGGGGQGAMNPQLMQMIMQLFQQGGQRQLPHAGSGYYTPFTGT